jgi:hypothetical protein
VEPDLVDWFEGAITLPPYRAAGFRGRRVEKRVLVRNTPEGELILLFDGVQDEVTEMFKSGDVDFEAILPDWNRCSLALLKQAYLSACMTYGILEGELADDVRRELIAARDAKTKQSVPVGKLAAGLTIYRTYDPITSEPLMRAVVHDQNGPIEGVLLAGRVFVSWSMTVGVDVPRGASRVGRRLLLGTPQTGTVTAVQQI